MIKIAGKTIGKGKPVFIIAEAGVNHNGRLDLALKLVDVAAEAGADAIKFQAFKAGQVVTEKGQMADYQKKNTGRTGSQLEMLRKLEFSESWYSKVEARCRERKIVFLSTPHGGFDSVDLLRKMKVPAFKFGSGDLNNLPLLKYAAKFDRPMILGTGMATMKEVKEAVKTIQEEGNSKIVLLHCTTNYPCPFEEVNLRAMQAMERETGLLVGYSDHTLGTQVPLMAVTLGAVLVEKHFTLDNGMEGPDHRASADQKVFKQMVEKIRNVEKILGDKDKKPNPSEKKMIKDIRKSLVALKDLKKGEKFNKDNIGIKRPGMGLEPKWYFKIIGKKAKTQIKSDFLLRKSDIA